MEDNFCSFKAVNPSFTCQEKKRVIVNKKNSVTDVQIATNNVTLSTQGSVNRKISQLERMFYLRCLLQLENGRLDKFVNLTFTQDLMQKRTNKKDNLAVECRLAK